MRAPLFGGDGAAFREAQLDGFALAKIEIVQVVETIRADRCRRTDEVAKRLEGPLRSAERWLETVVARRSVQAVTDRPKGIAVADAHQVGQLVCADLGRQGDDVRAGGLGLVRTAGQAVDLDRCG